ncbi:hypothetical protein [Halopenitus malekzadehii]|uniref:hypothetical protein n=1 Tax=Halopenitus malekzadehii TaxID=1267564 RepID=UPI00115F96F1|nr:hypothetical protein [Halopenitus malekzadehii]
MTSFSEVKYKQWNPCPDCEEKTIRLKTYWAGWPDGFNGRLQCDSCGAQFEDNDTVGRADVTKSATGDDSTDSAVEDDSEDGVEIREPGFSEGNSGVVLFVNLIGYLSIVTGFLLVITLVGIPLGVVFFIGGVILAAYGNDSGDTVETIT